MELVYLNEPARGLVPEDWFGRRCFEIFPTADDVCAFHCPTMAAVHDAQDVIYCEEELRVPEGGTRELGVAVIPLLGMSGDEARAVLLMRSKKELSSEDELMTTARQLRGDLLTHFERG